MEVATFGGGCFWCTEAVFKRLKGVESVEPGYAGGTMDNPSYEAVSGGQTGHAESIQIKFDPKVISFDKLLAVFFATHDPTTLNQQGADIGTQYRSVIFYHDENQQQATLDYIKKLQDSGKFSSKIVTKVEPFTNFYPAESYHKNYYENHQDAPYCQLVIDPKIQKLYRDFKTDLKE